MKKRLILLMVLTLILSVTPIMSKQANAATSEDIASYAKQFLGTPYRFGGTTPSGFDCSGYILYVFNHFGISLPRTSVDQSKFGTAVAKQDLQKGDLVFFANTYKPGISHAGIYIGDGNVISAESQGIAISNINTNPYWGPKYATARRVAGVSTAVSDATGKFSDISASHPAFEAIEIMTDRGIVNGYANNQFKPDAQVTRGQAAEMVNRVLKLQPKSSSKFSDVGASNPFANSINAMQEAGILRGYSNGTYGYNESLTKAQLAIIMDRAFQISDYSQATTAAYNNVPSSYWAYEAIQALKTIDQTPVFQSSNFNVSANASRAEFTAAVYSSMEAK